MRTASPSRPDRALPGAGAAWLALLLGGLSLALTLTVAPTAVAGPEAADAGKSIYRLGLLPSGQALRGSRQPGMEVRGAAAACINCHRRSGLGMIEGRANVPPVAAAYLFQPRSQSADQYDLPFVETMKPDRDPYTATTLAHAIRDGVGADGRPLSFLMPRFSLDDAEMTDLIEHLKTLSPGPVPGVGEGVLHFATIFTPDADPDERRGVLEVLQKFFDDKNRYTRAEAPRLRSTRHTRFMVNRHWQLHVWQLEGPAETWEAQLRRHLAAEPVYAVLSGAGGANWAPVHRFCEAEAVPCLFPNVDLPVDAEHDYDNVYFSRGVLLEAQLIAQRLTAQAGEDGAGRVRRVVQIFRDGDVGRAAAATLATAIAGTPGRTRTLPVIERALPAASAPSELHASVGPLQPGDALVLWLRPSDVAALGQAPAQVAAVYLSGRMAGLEQAPLPAGWRGITLMTYPFDLPAHDRVQRDYPLGWFRLRGIPVLAEQAQADTYLACIILSDTLNHMADSFMRDYLVERIESTLAHRILTGYYPRLTLGPGQRFASKGGYLVRFAQPTGTAVLASGAWTVP